jgi:exonuclease VII large subunit
VGIGHEDDQTLADEVADYRFMTPTHAGEVVPKRADLIRSAPSLRSDSIRPIRVLSMPNSPPR